jgi:hypothetical protein
VTTLNLENGLTVEIFKNKEVTVRDGLTEIEVYDTVSEAIQRNAAQSLIAEIEGETEVAKDCKMIAVSLIKWELEARKSQR